MSADIMRKVGSLIAAGLMIFLILSESVRYIMPLLKLRNSQ